MILAKIKGRRKRPTEHRILFSVDDNDERFNFYRVPAISESTKFNPEKKLTTGEWYYVQLNTNQIVNLIGPYQINANSSADLNRTVEADYSEIEVVYRVFEQGQIIFTKVTDQYRVKNRTIFKFYDTEDAKLIKEENSIIFTGQQHAYYDGVNKLYFRNFGTIRSMFPGVEDFYREATREEKERFLDNELFLIDDLDADMIGPSQSSRIAVILADKDLAFDKGTNTKKIIESAKAFKELGIELDEGNKIIINDQRSLKLALDLISSKFYTSSITGKKMRSYGSVMLDADR